MVGVQERVIAFDVFLRVPVAFGIAAIDLAVEPIAEVPHCVEIGFLLPALTK